MPRITPAPFAVRNRWKIFAALLLFGLLASLLVLLLMVKVHEEIAQPFLERFDRHGLQLMHAHTGPTLTRIALTLSWIGSPRELIPGIAMAGIILWLRHLRRDAAILVLALGGSGILDTALKLHFRRIRPEVPWAIVHEHSFSFPSGHSVAAVVLYGVLTYLLWRHLHDLAQRAAVILAALLSIAGIGLSRIYLGVHYPSDILAGYTVGLIWLLSVVSANDYVQRLETVSHKYRGPSTRRFAPRSG